MLTKIFFICIIFEKNRLEDVKSVASKRYSIFLIISIFLLNYFFYLTWVKEKYQFNI